MIIDKNFPGVTQLANETYVYCGSLIADEDITINLDAWFQVRGNIICNGDLIVKKQVTVFGDMMATGDIVANEISVKGRVVAGGAVKVEWLDSVKLGVQCEKCVDHFLDDYGYGAAFLKTKTARVGFVKMAILNGSSDFICHLKRCSLHCKSGADKETCIRVTAEYIFGAGDEEG